ncbi:hypothetical protein HY003_03385 [Candidatus Saccharibacteria bacterium]|nr:hypothetical protein [Candidatus Saccharibacteria bacterium]MBI3338318.1 hypothetical protein [Candidatus Saccharibacteria bacterium]
MTNRQNTIEFNGKRYDITSGKLVDATISKSPTPTAKAGTVLDGFIRRPDTMSSAIKKLPDHMNSASQKIINRTERSKTLMRSAVNKPVNKIPGSNHIQDHQVINPVEASRKVPSSPNRITSATNGFSSLDVLSGISPPDKTVFARANSSREQGILRKSSSAGEQRSPRQSSQPVSQGRILRADHIKKSRLISKFGSGFTSPKITTLPVQPVPTKVPTTPINLPHHANVIAVPAKNYPLTNALANTSSHEQPKIKRHTKLHHRVARKLHVSPRTINISAVSMAILLLTGFIAYQNVPNIAMRIATTRSGVHGSLPDYQPSGFALYGPIEYKSGQITINFKSSSDDRNFKIIQQSSTWNSETLLGSLVDGGKQPMTLQERGRTIYIYDNANAVWVNAGIKYQIEGNSKLSSDQLRRLVSSM